VKLDPHELVKLARGRGYDLFPLLTHCELGRFWARCVDHQVDDDADDLLNRLALHVPGVWRSDELSRHVRPLLACLYGRTALPVVQVTHGPLRTEVHVGAWLTIAEDLMRLPLHVVRDTEVARSLKMVRDPPSWLTDWSALTIHWFAFVEPFKRTVYVPAHEPVDIDPRGVLTPPVPPRYIVACTVGEQRVPMFGPYASDTEAEAHVERATQCARNIGWDGNVEVISAILPGRLTMCGHLAPRCAVSAEARQRDATIEERQILR
jgi:hypothetical protein